MFIRKASNMRNLLSFLGKKTDLPDVVVLTGMRHSGASIFAKHLVDAGVACPGDLIPASRENPTDRWQAREVAQLNDQAFAMLGMDWQNHRKITNAEQEEVLTSFARDAARVLALLKNQAQDGPFIINDSRFCRLMPLWIEAIELLDLRAHYVATVRAPQAVAHSLFRPVADGRYDAKPVANPSKAMLLWARYMLDLERDMRNHSLQLVRFSDLEQVSASDVYIEGCCSEVESISTISATNLADMSLPKFCAHIQSCLEMPQSNFRDDQLEAARAYFNKVTTPYDANAGVQDGPPVMQLTAAFGRSSASHGPPRIGFLSGAPRSKGHVYRIENRIEALIGEDWISGRIDLTRDRSEDIIAACDVLFVFRMEMTPTLEALYALAQIHKRKVIFDIDDLIFDPAFMNPKFIAFLENASQSERLAWRTKCENYRNALAGANVAFVPTETLAEYASAYVHDVYVVPNGLSQSRLCSACRLSSEPKAKPITIGYASGTATHDRDFAEVAHVLAETLTKHPDVKLVLQGPVQGEGVDALEPVKSQIERRDLVPFEKLPYSLHQFDINIAPLEVGNPFCESKSELKYFEAALVGVPSIVSRTNTFANSLEHGVTGLLAESSEEWREALEQLVTDKAFRLSLGKCAKAAVMNNYSPNAHRPAFKRAVERVMEMSLSDPGFDHATPPNRVTNEEGFSLIEVLVSLAIASIISLLIFGSLRQQFELIDRVQSASAEALDLQARTRLMSNVLLHTSPAWPENDADKFSGTREQISGVTGEAIFGDRAAMQGYRLRIIQLAEASSLSLETAEGVWEMGKLPLDAHFLYYGHDGIWHTEWPPNRPTPRTIADMDAYARTGKLPSLVKVHSEQGEVSEAWVFAIYNTDALSVRTQDLIGRQDFGIE